MSRIAIVSLVVSPGDAVGNDALEMQRILSAGGHNVGLFSSHWLKKTAATKDVAELADFLADDPQAILVYHHSTGWSAGMDLLRRTTCRRVVRYHNVTPGRFFAGFPGDMVPRLPTRPRTTARVGAGRLRSLSLGFGLQSGGIDRSRRAAERCAVVPPFHHIDRLHGLTADPKVLDQLDDGRTNLLFVGRRAPNKGHRYLLDAFAVYHEHYERNSRLLLVGRQDRSLASYTNLLREQASRLGVLDSILFIDGVSDAELKAYYQRASVFVLASEHEGFCVPVVEAMALQVPIVAYGTTAVPHTVGDAGLVWEEPDPFLLAQSIDAVVRDVDVRRQLTERGWRRYQALFANQRLERDFLHALQSIAA